MTTSTAVRRMLDIKPLDEFISPDNRNLKAVVDSTCRFGGVPTVVVGIYQRGERAWIREDTVHVNTKSTSFRINEQSFWTQVYEAYEPAEYEDAD